MRWHRFVAWCCHDVRIGMPLSASGGGGARIGVRHHRHKGRCLIALVDCDAHEQLFRIPHAAVLQSIDVVETDAAIQWWAQCQQEQQHDAIEPPPGVRYTTIRDMCFRGITPCEALPKPLVVEDWERDMWMLAVVMVDLHLAQHRRRRHTLPFAPYLMDCLPRNPRNEDSTIVTAYGHLLPKGALAEAIRVQRERERRIARHLTFRFFHGMGGGLTDAGVPMESEAVAIDPTAWRRQSSSSSSANVCMLQVAQMLQWAFASVQTRAHLFSFNCSMAAPRRYPLSARALAAQHDEWYHTLTLCPWFDMINDGARTNVAFMDVPTTWPGVVEQPRQAAAFCGKNRDLLIASGPRGIRRGEELVMCYTPVRFEGQQSTGGGGVDVVATLLRFGFLPALAASTFAAA